MERKKTYVDLSLCTLRTLDRDQIRNFVRVEKEVQPVVGGRLSHAPLRDRAWRAARVTVFGGDLEDA